MQVDRHLKQVLRCNSCGYCVSGSHPPIRKWQDSARTAIIIQKTHGMPFHRLSKLQRLCGVPVAPSTLWQQCSDVWQEVGCYSFAALLDQLAQSQTLLYDDTGAKILSVANDVKGSSSKLKKCYTTVIRGYTSDGDPIVAYVTGEQTAGKKLGCVLQQRTHQNHQLKLMTDASSTNNIKMTDGQVEDFVRYLLHGHCLSHGRRKFYDLLPYYPEICQYFLEQIDGIYHNEHICRSYSKGRRFRYHKRHSWPLMKNIYNKINELFATKQVEPNSRLGQNMKYWLNNKDGLTKFLKVKGMVLDNNSSEESLRAIILQRKNSLFFKTPGSAEVLSGLHSLVKTCEVNGINSFAYLNWLQANAGSVSRNPRAYSPFAYRKSLPSHDGASRAPPMAA